VLLIPAQIAKFSYCCKEDGLVCAFLLDIS